jgi:glycosyltransferase involved in cell wall biosynthesis
MKICFITDTYCDCNGVSRFLHDILHIAEQRGDDIFLITSTKKKCSEFSKNAFNIKPLIAFPIPYYKELDVAILSYSKVARVIDEIRPDFLHISTPGIVGFQGLRYAKKHNIPMYGTYHTDFPSYVKVNTKSNFLTFLTKKYLRYFYKDFRLVFTRSDAYIKTLSEDILFPNTIVKSLKIGIDTNKFTPFYKESNDNKEMKRFLYVGRITKEKNIDLILEIFQKYIDETKARLFMVGGGNIAYYRKKYPNKNIEFIGKKEGEELYRLYANSDFFLFPSLTDTLGQVVLEALSCATPVIVTQVGGPKEILLKADKKIGYILDTNNPADWLDTIQAIICDKIDVNTLCINAREFACTLDIKQTYRDFLQAHQI